MEPVPVVQPQAEVQGDGDGARRAPRSESKATVKPKHNDNKTRSKRNFQQFLFKRSGVKDKDKDKEPVVAEAVDGLEKLTLGEPTPVADFGGMGLNDNVLKGIHACGYEKPAECQQMVIVPLVQGRDVICQAQSGMGKTAAFCISILQRLDVSVKKCQALVLVPTRELAFQICDVLEELGKPLGAITVPCIGQDGQYKQNVKKLKEGVHIAVGTCGRICHLLYEREKPLAQAGIKTFVIDEADKMIIGSSYTRDLQYIIHRLPITAQFVIMSATMPSLALDRIQGIMRNPFVFLVKNEQLTLDGIQQFHVNVGTEEHKMETLAELFPLLNSSRGVTFCNTRAKARKVCKQMQAKGHTLVGMVGSMDQTERNQTLKDFKAGKILSLVASDLLGRGVDIQHLKLVINYDFPEKTEDYIHRIGRAGRYGRKGVAITFILDSEEEKLKKLAEFYHTDIPAMPVNVGDLMEMVQ